MPLRLMGCDGNFEAVSIGWTYSAARPITAAFFRMDKEIAQ
jgi:hypothetical protein